MVQLDNNYSLTTQPHLNGVRLIVLDNGTEWVCRKESFKNLSQFMALAEGKIFKGRLQLYKHHNTIAIEVKGTTIGTVSTHQLQQILQ